ncbi:MAG: hypothetical protein ACKO6I_09295, partial [Sphingomonadales bacterium]
MDAPNKQMPYFSALFSGYRTSKILVLSLFYAFFTLALHASEAEHTLEKGHENTHSEEKMDAGKLIMEHISDSHDWHLWGHTSIPLPVIVYAQSQGVLVFSSSRFNHG